MRFRHTLTVTIILLVVASLAYMVGARWAGYGIAFLNLPLWLLWFRTKLG